MNRWTQIFKLFSNPNRGEIVRVLSDREKLSVTEIADKLDISLKATSKHLILLENAGVLESKGKDNRVYYWLNQKIPKDVYKVIKLFNK